ncbi:hypothetical protein KHA90_05375 [Flavobacterium psychroterrae]|uniref:Lipocalin-like domain-containing protein n=1 Tax=Flavobacterium psychroterrae TaxID=2133767 RepID=A0ABS5P811_9FLAO|nr:hypothetical protein [Flavobacterium psychroterrae]MBS7230449.1 hypothetical protein [Flavobacterium psychroterrae]
MYVKSTYLFFLFIAFNLSAQTETTDLCNQIYGKWKTYYTQLPYRITPTNNLDIWIFNENGIVTINNKPTSCKLAEDCSKLIISNDLGFFSIEILGDTLFLNRIISVHESHNIYLKKTN